MFPISFHTSIIAVAQIFAMGAMGYGLVRSGLIREPGLHLLSFLSVNIFFPLFIFYQITQNFNPHRMPFWWQFPLINIILVLTGLCLSWLVLMRHRSSLKDAFLAASSLHNAGYIPILMIMSLPLGGWAGGLYACVILSIIGFDTCLWSLGVWLVTRGKSSRMDLSKMLNPPLLSMAAALIVILAFGPNAVPGVILKPVKILGDAAMAVAMIIIGGNLGLSNLKQVDRAQVAGIVLIKLIALPMITLTALSMMKVNPLVSLVAMIQSCMPTSITLSIIGRNYETKNQDLINQSIFFTHLLSMLTIPVFLGLYGRLMPMVP